MGSLWSVMASVRQRKGSANWYACITIDTPAGRKQRQFSTGLDDKAEAMAIAVAAERAARKHSADASTLRQALERIAEEFTTPEDLDPGPWLREWAQGRKADVAPGTWALYLSATKRDAAWLKQAGITRFSQLTPAVCQQLRADLAKVVRPPTVNQRMVVLSMALTAAVRAGHLTKNPLEDMIRMKAQPTKRREFRPAELDLLLPTLTGEWRALTLLGLYTGQRLNDLVGLSWRNVDLVGRTLTFTTSKTARLTVLPILKPAAEALEALPSADDPGAKVFPSIFARERSPRSQDFRALLAAVGLARPVGERTGRETAELSFHSLRHTATSMLKAAGVSDAIARAIVGHESAAVSRSYTHLDLDTMRREMEKMATL